MADTICFITRPAFFDAAYQADGEAITLLQLMESMFELGFLDVSDMRWRTPTKLSARMGNETENGYGIIFP